MTTDEILKHYAVYCGAPERGWYYNQRIVERQLPDIMMQLFNKRRPASTSFAKRPTGKTTICAGIAGSPTFHECSPPCPVSRKDRDLPPLPPFWAPALWCPPGGKGAYFLSLPVEGHGSPPFWAMKNSAIQWTKDTFNPWWGCSKVSPGCAQCSAQRRIANDMVSPTSGERRLGGNLWRRALGRIHSSEPRGPGQWRS